jgi:hypothetical protein
MPGFMPGIHVLRASTKQDLDGRDTRAFTPVFDELMTDHSVSIKM